jgi:hypothetical protein
MIRRIGYLLSIALFLQKSNGHLINKKNGSDKYLPHSQPPSLFYELKNSLFYERLM